MTYDKVMKSCNESTFSDGDELMFHLSSLGASVVPLPADVVQTTGQVVTTELNMMSCLYRGEDERYWVVDVTSVDPPIRDCRLLKTGVDFIGVKSTLDVVKRRLKPA